MDLEAVLVRTESVERRESRNSLDQRLSDDGTTRGEQAAKLQPS